MSGQAPRIAIVDHGMGNRRSVEKALEHVGARAQITRDHARLREADGVILPGVGAFPRAMANMRALGLDEVLCELAAAGTPLLGICLGMQLLFDSSSELGGAEGLGLIAGEVRELDAEGVKLPHMGWNEVGFRAGGDPLLADIPARCAFYHLHTFAVRPATEEDILGTADYGGEFVTAVRRGSLAGVQFHPEKSSAAGLRLLGNFARTCAPAHAAAA